MPKNLTQKILASHLKHGTLKQGEEIDITVNQTLTQDSTGTMVYLQLEAMNIKTLKTDLSVAYIDHNMLQSGFENADDHAFIQSICQKYGIVFSKPGNGICHQLHLERFAKPGDVLIGSDSHTPTCGGMGTLAIGAGGLDVALGMAKGIYTLKMPKVIQINLIGQLKPWATAKDVILHILDRLTVTGGVNAIIEYTGPGVKMLSVPERATITNMGAELGATTSLFPSDDRTYSFLKSQGRENDYQALQADADAHYDQSLTVDLSTLEPYVALPHSPDKVVPVRTMAPIAVDQVAIGSCTNASYADLMAVASLLKGKTIHPTVSLVISPGSSSILKMLATNGALADLIASGARILEAGCGPCIGMGQAPKSQAVSLRTFNRNFKGRCGTQNASVFLVSPETAAASALTGVLTSPETCGLAPTIAEPLLYDQVTSYFIHTKATPDQAIEMGPNIKPFPINTALADSFSSAVLLKTGDDITTDDIMPSGAKLLPYRSNIPELSKHCFKTVVTDFKSRADRYGGGIVIGGHNYGQGSSREHAALVPLYLGVKAVIAKSFARIHHANLINAGILPLVFVNPHQYDQLSEYDVVFFSEVLIGLKHGHFNVINKQTNQTIPVQFMGSEKDVATLIAGGALQYHALEV